MKMQSKNIGQIAEVIAGQSPPSDSYNEIAEGLPFYQGKTDFGNLNPIPRKWCTNPKKTAEVNDILMSVRAPVGPVNLANEKACIGRGLGAIRAKGLNDFRYIYYFLKNNQELVSRYSTGSTFKSIPKGDIEKIRINVPKDSLDQKRIAQVLADCEDLIAKRKESIALLDELLKSTFLEMFGDPRNNEGNWEFDKVIEYADCIVPGRDKPKSFTGDIPWVTTNDLKHLSFTKESKDKIGLSEDEISEVKARTVPSGSVLMTCVGDLGVVSIATQRMLVNQQLHSFQCKDSINNIFLMYALSFQTEYMYKRASTTTVPYLNKTNCNSIPVIKPPIDLQTEFALKVEKVEEIKKLFQNHLTEIENLYSRLSQDAFKGVLDLSKMVLKKSSFNLEKSEAAIKSQIITEAQTKYNQTPVEIEFIIDNVLNKDFDNKIFSVLDIWKKTKNHQTNITSSLIRSSLKEYIKNDKIEQVYDENLKEILFKLKK